MKYPISLNDKDLAEIDKIGRWMGMDNIHSVYGGVPKVIKFSISLTLQTLERLKNDIPTLHPDTLDIFLSCIRKIKTDEFYQLKKDLKENP